MKNEAATKNIALPAWETSSLLSPRAFRGRLLAAIVVGMLTLAAAGAVQAQTDNKISSAEESFSAVLSKRFKKAAAKAGVTLSPGVLGYGDTPEIGLVASASVPGAAQINSDGRLTISGKFLFIYIGSNLTVPAGYYTLNLEGQEVQVLGPTGAVVATLRANVINPPPPAPLQGTIRITLSIEIDESGVTFDIKIEINSVTATVSATVPLHPLT
ncbi:MAG TPA: hypothetical protein VLZ81_07845 [Blastocatellia bacterium]|nr:hypothetical protein [Blastocatellia bacterium]